MTVDINYWLENIIKVSSDLSRVLEIVKPLRFSYFTKKDKIAEIEKNIDDLTKKMVYLNKIGSTLDEYIYYHTESRILYTEIDKFIELMNRYKTDLYDKSSTFHIVHWETIENAFKDITKIKSEYINIILDRINYFDDKDAAQIKIYVTDFNSNYDKSTEHLRGKNLDDLKRNAEALSEKSLTIHNLFKGRIKNMTDALKKV